MSKIIFNEMQMKQLEKNENVVKVSERSITYRADFKVKAVKENQIGKGKKAYLSCVKDSTTREILAYHVSTSLQMDIVYQTLDKLKDRLGDTIHPEALLHSNQGIHYTHPEFQCRVKEMGLRQSMSRRGNCLDNARMESFFGHMKDELDYKCCQTFQSLQLVIEKYMQDYNYDRYQWTLKKMAPEQ